MRNYIVPQNIVTAVQREPFLTMFLSIARYQISFYANNYFELLPIVSIAFNISISPATFAEFGKRITCLIASTQEVSPAAHYDSVMSFIHLDSICIKSGMLDLVLKLFVRVRK